MGFDIFAYLGLFLKLDYNWHVLICNRLWSTVSSSSMSYVFFFYMLTSHAFKGLYGGLALIWC